MVPGWELGGVGTKWEPRGLHPFLTGVLTWFPRRGPNLVPTRFQLSTHLVPTVVPDKPPPGSHVVHLWFQLGPHLVHTWFPRGPHVVPTWLPGVNQVNQVGTGWEPGRDQVGTRWGPGGNKVVPTHTIWFTLGSHLDPTSVTYVPRLLPRWSPHGHRVVPTPPPPLPTVRRVCCHFGPSDG